MFGLGTKPIQPVKLTAIVECRRVWRSRTQLGDPSKDLHGYQLYTFLRQHDFSLEQYCGSFGYKAPGCAAFCDDDYHEPFSVITRSESFLALGVQYAFSLYGPVPEKYDRGPLVKVDREPTPATPHRWRFYSVTMGSGLWWPCCHFAVSAVGQGGTAKPVPFKRGQYYRVSLSAELPER
jgi:hypothetical protein